MPKNVYNSSPRAYRPVHWDRHKREHHGRPTPESQAWADVVERAMEEEDDE